jgi:BNR repeat-like domain
MNRQTVQNSQSEKMIFFQRKQLFNSKPLHKDKEIRYKMRNIMQNADFISESQLVTKHLKDQSLIGQAVVKLKDDSLMMVVPMGRAPADFEDREIDSEMPLVFISLDNGRNWKHENRLDITWNMRGIICGGGASLKYLTDGRLVMLLHRKVRGFHGGGSPVFLTSSDHGKSWTKPELLTDKKNIFYLMNDRLLETKSGRLLVPVAIPAAQNDYYEGGACDSGCFYSDDKGKSWRFSNKSHLASLPGDSRGMAEPGIVELSNGKLMMLCRTGGAYLYQAWSDDSGNSWSHPQKTSLLSPCSSFAISKLDDGRIIVLYNHTEAHEKAGFFPRNPLAYSISENDGQTWQPPVLIDSSSIKLDSNHLQHIYPAICQMNNELLVSYTTHRAPPKEQFKRYKRLKGGLKTAIIRI